MTDFPILEVAHQAEALTKDGAKVHQKWTCKWCGSRQTMEEANKFYMSGICEECGKTSEITHCNYVLIKDLRK